MDDQALTALLLRYQANRDPRAIETLFEATAPRLAGIARRLVKSQADADDLLQTTFLAVLESIDRFRPDQPPMGWLIGILTNKARYQRRQAGRAVDPERLEQELPPLPDLAATRAEEAQAVAGALAGLPDLYRRVLEMVLGEELPPSEIAARLERSPGAVRTQLHRGIAMLKRALPAGVALPSMLVTLDSSTFDATRQLLVEKAREKTLVSAASSTVGPGLVASLVAGGALVAVAAVASGWSGEPEEEPVTPGTTLAATAPAAIEEQDEQSGEPREEAGRAQVAQSKVDVAGGDDPAASQEPEAFTFHLADDEGFSFARMAVVDEKEADVSFPWSNTLETRGLAASTATAPPDAFALPEGTTISADAYLNALVAVDPADESGLLAEPSTSTPKVRIRFRERNPSECVWVIRLDDGRFAAIARVNEILVPNGPIDDPRRYERAHAETVYHGVITGTNGVFQPEARSAFSGGGFTFRVVREDRHSERIEAQLAQRIGDLETEIERQRGYVWPTPTGETRVSGVLSRGYAGEITRDSPSYVAATFSFEHGSRTAANTRNDWSFCYSDGRIDFATVTDDRSRAWNLGRAGFGEVPFADRIGTGDEELRPAVDDLLLIHTLDGDTDRWDLLKVLRIDERMLVFQWLPFDDEAWFAERTEHLRPLAIGPDGVWIQMRGGAGGGNPRRAFFDGTKNARIDELSADPFDTSGPVDSDEDCLAFIQGGGSLPGHAWEISSIEYSATTAGDSNGPGRLRVVIDGEVVIDIPESPASAYGVWTGSQRMLSASDSYVEIQNSSSADVRIRGTWVRVPEGE